MRVVVGCIAPALFSFGIESRTLVAVSRYVEDKEGELSEAVRNACAAQNSEIITAPFIDGTVSIKFFSTNYVRGKACTDYWPLAFSG